MGGFGPLFYMDKLLHVLSLVATIVEKAIRKAKEIRNQKEVDQIYEDPVGWFDDHFPYELRDEDVASETRETSDLED